MGRRKRKFRRIWLEPNDAWTHSWVATTIDDRSGDEDEPGEWQDITFQLADCGNRPVNIEFGFVNSRGRRLMKAKLKRLQSALDKIQEALDAE